ncbi:hypothetical protein KR222_005329 [Zaprionus bogoriensis]|nr:hypothetical protein KR222_005329 [Zaprionus bogoriensis]
MHRSELLLLLLLSALPCLLAAAIYDADNQLDVSASCPQAACSLWQLQSDFQHPLRYVSASGKLPLLQQLLLGDCQWRALPVELFRLTPELRVLVLHNSSVYMLNKEDFQDIPRLQQLQLQRTHLTQLRPQQFAKLPNLEALQLNHNIIQFMHDQAFEGLPLLQLLGLRGNGIVELAGGIFAALTNLQHLDLSGNEIEAIDAHTFAGNGKLQTLLLNDNKFLHFEANALLALTNLRLLDLSRSGQLLELKLHSVQRALLESCGLRRLAIAGSVIDLRAAHNALEVLRIGDKSAVIELDLHGNQLGDAAISGFCQGMWNLQRLDLSMNNIELLVNDSDASSSSNLSLSLQLPSLTHLDLAYNELRRLPAESPLLSTRLAELNISHNEMLRPRTEHFAGLSNLQRLYMAGLRLSEFDYRVFHAQHTSLQELGICDTNDYPLLHKVAIYFRDRGVQLPGLCQRSEAASPKPHVLADTPQPEPQPQALAGVCGIHPYWTTRDILAFLTLLVVFAILLMQLYHILQEEGCLRRLQQWVRSWRQPTVVNGSRARRLNEEYSEV